MIHPLLLRPVDRGNAVRSFVVHAERHGYGAALLVSGVYKRLEAVQLLQGIAFYIGLPHSLAQRFHVRGRHEDLDLAALTDI